MIAIDLDKQQALDVDPKAIQRIDFRRSRRNRFRFFTGNCGIVEFLFLFWYNINIKWLNITI